LHVAQTAPFLFLLLSSVRRWQCLAIGFLFNLPLEKVIMKLTYRGVQYSPSSSVNLTIPGEGTGQYRESAWRQAKLTAPLSSQIAAVLRYRGVVYATQPGMEIPVAKTVSPTKVNAAAPAKQAHRKAILINIERRMEAAHSRSDYQLLKLLEDELRYFTPRFHP
jgi:hypothetical protein